MKILITIFTLMLFALPTKTFCERFNLSNKKEFVQRRYQIEKQKLTIKAAHKTDDPMKPYELIIYEFEISYTIFKADKVKTVTWRSLNSYNVNGQKKVPIDWSINDAFVASLVPQETNFGYEVTNL